MIMRNNKERAELVKGYTDGTFYYYRTDVGFWHAVHPMVGLSVCCRGSRREVIKDAYNPFFVKRINDEIDKREAVLSAAYRVAIAEAQEVVHQ